MASAGISVLLDLEEASFRETDGRPGDSGLDTLHVPCQSAVGSAENSWRAPLETRRGKLRQLLQHPQDALVFSEGRSRQATGSSPDARENSLTTISRRTPS